MINMMNRAHTTRNIKSPNQNIYPIPSTSRVGFIILRCVNSEETNKYWMLCYRCVRKYYPEHLIIIIDDNSNKTYITNQELYKTTIIDSEYHGRGELLPYYYYLQNKLFDSAVIIHDSVFINSQIDINVDKYKIMWDFGHSTDHNIEDETIMIDIFENPDFKKFYENKKLWTGCFGCMSIITHDYLVFINNNFDISKLLALVKNRTNRMSLERVFACILQYNGPPKILFGNIHKYCPWGIKFDNRHKYNHLPVIKVWSGR